MANFVLDKGYLATGGVAYAAGDGVVLQANGKSIAKAGNLAAGVVFVCMEDIDATKVATGKAVINCRVIGIARVQLGAAAGVVVVGSRLSTDAAGKWKLSVATNPFHAVALQAGSNNDFIDALLLAGAQAVAP